MPGLNLRGDATNNFLVGSLDRDTLMGRHGLDTVIGLDGDDLIWGNDDDDVLFGNAGRDSLYGGKSNDTLEGGKDDDELSGNQGDDVILGNDGNDVVLGGGGNDLVFGGIGNDSLFGNSGNDVLFGGQGNDAIFGGKGNDHLEGDKGDDTIYGDVGADTITGGDGRDVIVLEESSRAALDTITDFQPSEDAVRLPDGTTFAELVFEPDGSGGTVVRDGRSGKALLVLPGVDSATLTPQNFQSSNPEPTPDPIAPPATETPEENEDTPDIPVTEPEPEPGTPTENPDTTLEPEAPTENLDPEPETPPTNNTPDPVPDTPPPADPPPDPVPENQPPTVRDDIATAEFNTAIEISVLNNDTDPDGDALTVTVDEESASNGTVTTDGTTVTYTPNAEFTGIDRVTYTVSDGIDSNTGSIEITVIPSEIRWIGGDPTDPTNWSNPKNWEFGIVPTENQDVLIPASAIHQPVLTRDAIVRNVLVEEGANINVADFVLITFGNIDAYGSILASEYNYDAGIFVEGNDVTIQGILPSVLVHPTEPSETANVRVIGETTINGDLTLDTKGYNWYGRPVFDINGQEVTVLGHVDAGLPENLVMNDTNDILNAGSFSMERQDPFYPADIRLTAGVINVFTSDFDDDYDISLQASGTHEVVLKGSEYKHLQSYLSSFEDIDELPTFHNLEIDNPAGITLGNVVISDTLTLRNGSVYGSRVFLRGSLVNLTSPYPELASDAWQILETVVPGGNVSFPEHLETQIEVIGDTTFESSFTLDGDLIVSERGLVDENYDRIEPILRLGGNEVSVDNFRTHYNAGLVMDDPDDVLEVFGEFELDKPEISQLTAGFLKLDPDWAFSHLEFFEASGTHTVVFHDDSYFPKLENPGPNPGQSHFQNVEIESSTAFSSETYINGNVTITNGGSVQSNFGYSSPSFYFTDGITIGGDLIDNTWHGNAWQAEVTTFTGLNPQLPQELKTTAKFTNQATLSNDFTLHGNLIVEAGGDLTVNSDIYIQNGMTVFLSDGFDGIGGSGSVQFQSSGVFNIGDLETTATIPNFRANPLFEFNSGPSFDPYFYSEVLYIEAHEGSEPHHGGILDVRYTDIDLEIVTRDGMITLGNFNTPDALATPGIIRLSSDLIGGDGEASLLSRNDVGELFGTRGNDRIIGKAEAQTIDGGDGEDIISGGAGTDVLTGGNHLDIFAYDNPSEGGDTITDFSSSQEDKIQFSSENFGNPTIEFNTNAASTNQATVYATPLSGGTQQVMFDADGIGVAQPVHLATLTNMSVALEDGDIYGYGAYPFHSSFR
ncbi:cadherin-like domain-containing protein [Oscillatoriales cyanobacterium LEGE 11467]|uniref:Cadherin-like domain-containing protein n=1 Tax=Zarconia navalis LEGE 11467 TaxID=1828826 RepID=A0A928Z6Z6_9CYAN|nr:Ig-like domain-containing protein [Zarconia navalis]MBE9040030.1 cadherin-like domain-containing protein [Zarconia navalis LEGE 11467]